MAVKDAATGERNIRVREYETWRIDFPRGISRGDVRRVLTEHAEYGRWELWRVRLFPDGRRRIWLRRRALRVKRPA
ncbi:MAG: DUF5703 family protein [Candidatus Nanopelagicales bacterium]